MNSQEGGVLDDKLEGINFNYKELKKMIKNCININLKTYVLQSEEAALVMDETDEEKYTNNLIKYYCSRLELFNENLEILKQAPKDYLEKVFKYINRIIKNNKMFALNEDLIFHDIINHLRRYTLRVRRNEKAEVKEQVKSMKKKLPFLLSDLIFRVIRDKKNLLLSSKQIKDEWTKFIYEKFQDIGTNLKYSFGDVISEYGEDPFKMIDIFNKADKLIGDNYLKYVKEFYHYESRIKKKDKTLTHFIYINILKCFPTELFNKEINVSLSEFEFEELTDYALKLFISDETREKFEEIENNKKVFDNIKNALANEVNKTKTYNPEINGDAVHNFALSCANIVKNYFFDYLENKLLAYAKENGLGDLHKNYGNAIILSHKESIPDSDTSEYLNFNYLDISDKLSSGGESLNNLLFPYNLGKITLPEPDINEVRACYSRLELLLNRYFSDFLTSQSSESYKGRVKILLNILDNTGLLSTEEGKKLMNQINESDYTEYNEIAKRIKDALLEYHFYYVMEELK